MQSSALRSFAPPIPRLRSTGWRALWPPAEAEPGSGSGSSAAARGGQRGATYAKPSGEVAHAWFDTMAEAVAELGVTFTAIGVVTEDPASVESVLSWASRLQDRVGYLIVENALTQHSRFTYWEESAEAKRFAEAFHPVVIRMDYRVPDLETATRNHGVTLGQVADRKTSAPELQRSAMVVRASAYRKKLFEEFEKARNLLIL